MCSRITGSMEPGQAELEKTKLGFPKNIEKTIIQELQAATPSEQVSYTCLLRDNGYAENSLSVNTEDRGTVNSSFGFRPSVTKLFGFKQTYLTTTMILWAGKLE